MRQYNYLSPGVRGSHTIEPISEAKEMLWMKKRGEETVMDRPFVSEGMREGVPR